MTTLTQPRLLRLARAWCPVPARWRRLLLVGSPAWGPAHEIAHALLSLPKERSLLGYGLCDPDTCRCPGERCSVVEVAAMMVSSSLNVRAGRPDLVQAEAEATDGYDEIMTRWYIRRAAALLRRRKLQRLPRTMEGLELLLARRLG